MEKLFKKMVFGRFKTKRLGISDLDEIVEVERLAFIPLLQASKEKIKLRLQRDHIYLGLKNQGNLIGTLAYRYAHFSPQDKKSFPKTFNEFSNNPNEDNTNTIFGYSLGVIPEYRSRESTLELVNTALKLAQERGMSYAVADGRCPSYNGSLQFEQEKILQNKIFKEAIDKWIKQQERPPLETLLKDPVLAFFHLFAKAGLLWLIPNFIPEDKPAGGHRVILYRKL